MLSDQSQHLTGARHMAEQSWGRIAQSRDSGCWDSHSPTSCFCCCHTTLLSWLPSSEHISVLTWRLRRTWRSSWGILCQGSVSFRREGSRKVSWDGRDCAIWWEEVRRVSLHRSCAERDFKTQHFSVIIWHFIAAFAGVWGLGAVASEMHSHIPWGSSVFAECFSLSNRIWPWQHFIAIKYYWTEVSKTLATSFISNSIY